MYTELLQIKYTVLIWYKTNLMEIITWTTQYKITYLHANIALDYTNQINPYIPLAFPVYGFDSECYVHLNVPKMYAHFIYKT